MVWYLDEAYRAVCQRTRRLDWDDVILETDRRMEARGENAPRHDFVLLDEAQDLTVSAIQRAARPEPPPHGSG